MFKGKKMRRAAGGALVVALAGIPAIVSTIELGSPMAAAPSRFVKVDDLPGLHPAPADWAFAPACFGEFWSGMDVASGWIEEIRIATANPFAGMPDGVSIVLAVNPSDASGGQRSTKANGRSGSTVSGPVLASLLASASGGGSAGGGSSGRGSTVGGSTETPDGGIDQFLPPIVTPKPEGEPSPAPVPPATGGTGEGGGGQTPVAAVPLPAGAPLLLTSLVALGLLGRRRILFPVRPRAACSE